MPAVSAFTSEPGGRAPTTFLIAPVTFRIWSVLYRVATDKRWDRVNGRSTGEERALFRMLRYEGLTSSFVMTRVMSREDFSPLIAATSPHVYTASPRGYLGENQTATGDFPGLRSRLGLGSESCLGLIGKNADLR